MSPGSKQNTSPTLAMFLISWRKLTETTKKIVGLSLVASFLQLVMPIHLHIGWHPRIKFKWRTVGYEIILVHLLILVLLWPLCKWMVKCYRAGRYYQLIGTVVVLLSLGYVYADIIFEVVFHRYGLYSAQADIYVSLNLLAWSALIGVFLFLQLQEAPSILPPAEAEKHLFKKLNGEQVWVEKEQILSIQSEDHYQKISLMDDEFYIRATMKELEEKLVGEKFQRVHRSALVNLRHVQRFIPLKNSEYYLVLPNEDKVKVSRTYGKRIKDYLDQH